MINELIKTSLIDIESQRRGLFTGVSGMLPTEFRRNLEQSPSGQDFSDFLVDRLLEDDEALVDQIAAAQNGNTDVAQQETVIGEGEEDNNTRVPKSLEHYITENLPKNAKFFEDANMDEAAAREFLTNKYNEKFGGS
jgi:hypothetical protein